MARMMILCCIPEPQVASQGSVELVVVAVESSKNLDELMDKKSTRQP